MYHIRPFDNSETDYQKMATIWNASWPDYPRTIDVIKHDDETRNPKFYWHRLVVEKNDQTIGFGIFCETWWSKRPGKYHISFATHPDYRRLGVGAAFYDHVMGTLSRNGLKMLTTDTRDDQPDAIQFLANRGFAQVMRYPESRLDIASFDPSPFNGLAEKMEQDGIEFFTMSQLMERDPDWLERWYEMETEIVQDIPSPDGITKQPLDEFKKMLAHPHFMTEGQHLAIDTTMPGGQYVGISGLWHNPQTPEKFNTGLTGVLRSHRRHGIATALKLRAITFAKQRGIKQIDTDNEENNPMYQINVRLGFKPLPAWLDFEKRFDK